MKLAVSIALALAGSLDLRGSMALAFDSFFDNPITACNVNTRRAVDDLVPTDGTWAEHLTYPELCDIALYPETILPPESLYSSSFSAANGECDGLTTSLGWPVCDPDQRTSWDQCSETRPTSPINECDWDRGWRYPFARDPGDPVPPSQPWIDSDDPNTPEAPAGAGGGWPICANAAASTIKSDPTVEHCSDYESSEDLHPVGWCIPSAHFYERLTDGSEKTPATRFFSFVANPEHCRTATEVPQWCGHEVLSAVNTCKQWCEHIFGKLRFDKTSAAWVLDSTNPMGTHRGLSSHVDHVWECSIVEQCKDACGPSYETARPFLRSPACPNNTPAPFPSGAEPFDIHEETPWFEKDQVHNAAESRSHWHYVSFGRDWNPNDTLYGWVRSYGVNNDKDKQPSIVCDRLVNHYCNTHPNSLNSTQEAACKQKFPPANFPGIPQSLATAEGDLGFCGKLFRGRTLCSGTCTQDGDNEDVDGLTMCGGDRPAGNHTLPAGLLEEWREEFTCNPATATCEIGSGSCSAANKAECLFARVYHPAKNSGNSATNPLVVTTTSLGLVAAFFDGYGEYPRADQATAEYEVDTNSATGSLVNFIHWSAAVPLQNNTVNKVTVTFTFTESGETAQDEIYLDVQAP